MKNRILPSLTLLLVLIIPSCNKSETPSGNTVVSISDLLPKDNEISGWARGAGADASWKATNASELQQWINGGSELFTNHEFVEAAMQKFYGTVNTQSSVECEIQIYDQKSSASSDAVFDDPNNVFANPLAPANPPSTRAQIRKDIFSFTMKFTKSKYYVLLTLYSADDKGQDVIEVFARNVAAKIK